MTDDLRTRIADVLIHAPAEWDEDDTAAALLPLIEAHGRASAATALRQAAPGPRDCCAHCANLHTRADFLEAQP